MNAYRREQNVATRSLYFNIYSYKAPIKHYKYLTTIVTSHKKQHKILQWTTTYKSEGTKLFIYLFICIIEVITVWNMQRIF